MKKLILATALLLATFTMKAQELIIISSDLLKCDDSILVFTPGHSRYCNKSDDNTTEAIPTLFLLHGWSGCYRNWADKSDLQQVSDRFGFRIICPDGFYNSWYANNVDKNKMQWRSFFDRELYPQMVEKYNLDPEKTFITGLSMGGLGAINIFLDDISRFRSAGSMSGVLDIYHTSPNLLDKELSQILGPYTPENPLYDVNNPIGNLDKVAGSGKLMVISCGYEDYYVKCTMDFAAKCREMKIPHIMLLSPGRHSWIYWDYALVEHLEFFKKILQGDNLGY